MYSYNKKIFFRFWLVPLTLIFMFCSSCGFQGRKYTTGHYWDGRNTIEYDSQNEKLEKNEKQKENGNEVLNENENENEGVRKFSIKSNDAAFDVDTLVIPLYRKGSKRYQKIQESKASENKQESPQSPALKGEHTNGSADTTLVSEIKALNKKFNTSAILFWSNGVFSTIAVIILGDINEALIFTYILAILTILSISMGVLALLYNGYISVKLGRKLRKNRNQLPKEKWIRRIKAKVLWVKLLFYLPLLLLSGLILAFVLYLAFGYR